MWLWPSSRHTRVSTIVSGVSPEQVEFLLEWYILTFWTGLLSTLLQPRVSRVPKWRKARCNEETENVFYHFICLLVFTFVKCVIKLWEMNWTSKIYLFRHLPNEFMHFPPNCPWKDPKSWKQPGMIRPCQQCLFWLWTLVSRSGEHTRCACSSLSHAFGYLPLSFVVNWASDTHLWLPSLLFLRNPPSGNKTIHFLSVVKYVFRRCSFNLSSCTERNSFPYRMKNMYKQPFIPLQCNKNVTDNNWTVLHMIVLVLE